jgi:hypothetical protein
MKTVTANQVLITSVVLLGYGLTVQSAMAATVAATILADNGSLAVQQQGNTFTVIPASVAGNWPTPKTFSFNIPDDPESLKQCKIHVVAWGDGGVAQGVMAHFAGTAGVAYTGQAGSPLNNVAMSSVMHAGGTAAGQAFANNNANAQSIIAGAGAANTAFVSLPVVSGGIPGTWGPVNLPMEMKGRGEVKFIWNEKPNNLNANPKNYRLLSLPCSSVVKPVPVATAHVASWEIAGQFNAAQNPYEVWTYGYTEKADCTGPMIPFKNKTSNSFMARSINQWQRGTTLDANDLPMVGQSKGDTLLAPLKWSPNGISMHPGPQGQCAVVRFTAPAAGNYRFMGRFWAQNTSGVGNSTDTNVMVTINDSTPPIVSGNIKALGSPAAPTNKPFMSTGVSLAVGSTIDFKVGANGNFISDSTGLHGYIQRDEP